MTKDHLQVGERLILTKPLGTGIANRATKTGITSTELTEQATQLMAALN
jgi:selenide,water dikinase